MPHAGLPVGRVLVADLLNQKSDAVGFFWGLEVRRHSADHSNYIVAYRHFGWGRVLGSVSYGWVTARIVECLIGHWVDWFGLVGLVAFGGKKGKEEFVHIRDRWERFKEKRAGRRNSHSDWW